MGSNNLGRMARPAHDRPVGVARGSRRCPAWLPALILVLVVGLGLNAAPIPESPGRWVPNPRKAVIKESEWILHYDVLQPRVGDRIPNEFFVALAENENAWARDYLIRQSEALRRAASRLPQSDTAAWRVVAADLAVLDHDQVIVEQANAQAIDPFSLRHVDSQGSWLRDRAQNLLGELEPRENTAAP